jgi:hypothetical protein
MSSYGRVCHMKRTIRCLVRSGMLLLLVFFLQAGLAQAQSWGSGHSIGTTSTDGNLIVVELDKGALGEANLFDLAGRTLRFTPKGAQYFVENTDLQWDSEFGSELTGGKVTLHNFAFPYSGQSWNSFQVGTTGSISFGEAGSHGPGGRPAGVSIGRFDPLSEAASTLVNTIPAMCVFFKPRMSGPHYVKELSDRVVITWDVTEPYGNIQDFTWVKTVNRFQAVLHRDGSIEMSYKQLAAKDAIVGIYPMLSGKETPLTTIIAGSHPETAAHLDVQNLKISVVDGLLLTATFETRGPVLANGNPALEGIQFRLFFDEQLPGHSDAPHASALWTAMGIAEGGPSHYAAFGQGVSSTVKASGNSIVLQGILPEAFRKAGQVAVHAEVVAPGSPEKIAQQISSQVVRLSGLHSAEVHLSSLTRKDGPFTLAYESFHYLSLPNPEDLSCTVIKALGDKFDFLAYYSDFRIDNQEAGTPSEGPLGGNVTGIGVVEHDFEASLDGFCSKGRLQWGYVQPVYAHSIQMDEFPPQGAPALTDHDITSYTRQLGERSVDGKMLPYNYAMSQIGHEMGHRWSAFASAKVNGEVITLGPVHWAQGLQAVVPFPYQLPTEASAMGGGVWQDNFDGTYTQLADNYYVPASGYSYLDLYLMGLISPAEVPDFFILRNLVPAGKDANGHHIYKADRTKVTIQDVIANEGPRLPDVYHSQRKFNTGMVVIVEHGQKPSRELIERVNGIRGQWIDYWGITTQHRASMTAAPQ